jgi:hypothetical protein
VQIREPLARTETEVGKEAMGPILTIIFVALVLIMVAVAYAADQRDY